MEFDRTGFLWDSIDVVFSNRGEVFNFLIHLHISPSILLILSPDKKRPIQELE